MNKKKYLPHFIGLIISCFFCWPHIVLAADEGVADVHWAYSSFFGTGWYSLDDNRSVFVMGLSPRQTVRTSSISSDGERKLGFEILYPVTLGLHNIDYLPGIIAEENFGTVSFTPGLEVEIPLTEHWYLRPFVNVGWGMEFETDETAWIYHTGIKSRYILPVSSESVEWSILGKLYYAGHKASESPADSLGGALLGIEARQALGGSYGSNAIDLHWHATYSILNNELNFSKGNGTSIEVDDIIEFGLAVSFRDKPFDFWLWKPQRLGLGFKISPDGSVSGITLNFRSWFMR